MLFAHGHSWTLRQRWLFVSATTVALAAFGILIYGYERCYRGPSDDVFYGTWQDTTPALDSISYFQFKPDHTALYLATGNGELSIMGKAELRRRRKDLFLAAIFLFGRAATFGLAYRRHPTERDYVASGERRSNPFHSRLPRRPRRI